MRLLVRRQVCRCENGKRQQTSTPRPGDVVTDGRVDRKKLLELLALSAEQEALEFKATLDVCSRAPRTPTALLRGRPRLTRWSANYLISRMLHGRLAMHGDLAGP